MVDVLKEECIKRALYTCHKHSVESTRITVLIDPILSLLDVFKGGVTWIGF